MTDLNTISNRLHPKFCEKQHPFLKEYYAIIKPFMVALDILQGDDNCCHGTLLPTLKVLMSKTVEMRDGLWVTIGLTDAIVQVRKWRHQSQAIANATVISLGYMFCCDRPGLLPIATILIHRLGYMLKYLSNSVGPLHYSI